MQTLSYTETSVTVAVTCTWTHMESCASDSRQYNHSQHAPHGFGISMSFSASVRCCMASQDVMALSRSRTSDAFFPLLWSAPTERCLAAARIFPSLLCNTSNTWNRAYRPLA